ncbi:hypothetical protein [Burkholderia contaminans]|uniref:hypothetical protein n=1 Tax=Burkholderia contaminans TaxID=488447 RepID=UPI001582D74D|nr:hypothetical protein [Burkholderia contaminans]
MGARYSRDLAAAASMLHRLRDDPEDLELLRDLQRFLVRQIAREERTATRLKMAARRLKVCLSRDRLPRERARRVKERISAFGELQDDLRHRTVNWRFFGDGIASIYQSTHALKHLYYDADYRPKEVAGFLTGKSGFRREWKLLNWGISMGVPVVLSDLTNIVRHGDICALGGADPVPVEVKSSSNRNSRTARQDQQRQALAEFYANDGAALFRGMANVRRIEIRDARYSHVDALNHCMHDSVTEGFATISPEPGLRYVAISDLTLRDRIGAYATRATLARQLTPTENWLPCYPFTLTMSTANQLRFILGDTAVVVLMDLSHMKALYEQRGVHATAVMDGVSSFQICTDPANLDGGVVRISEVFFARVALEFQSLTWFVDETVRLFHRTVEDMAAIEATGANVPTMVIPTEWFNLRDCYDVEQ